MSENILPPLPEGARLCEDDEPAQKGDWFLAFYGPVPEWSPIPHDMELSCKKYDARDYCTLRPPREKPFGEKEAIQFFADKAKEFRSKNLMLEKAKSPTSGFNYQEVMRTQSPYHINLNGQPTDFYAIMAAMGNKDAAIEHALKKLLFRGKRTGGKSARMDVEEAIKSLGRWMEIDAEGKE